MGIITTTTNLVNKFAYNVNDAEEHYGDRAQRNYRFLDRLWQPGAAGTAVRNNLIADAQTSQAALKANADFANLQLNLQPDVYVALLDCESGRLVYDTVPPAHPNGFYILMLPGRPQARNDRSYIVAQQWAEAWYHAVRETGGM